MARSQCAFRVLSALLLLFAAQAFGGVVSTSGQVVQIAPPGSIAALSSATQIDVFQETSDVTLPMDVVADITSPGSYDFSTSSSGTIPKGTAVDSYYLHSRNGNDVTIAGSVTFATAVLGIWYQDGDLASYSFLLAPGTSYDCGCGMENDGDKITLSPDGETLDVSVFVSQPGDDLQIITAAAPVGTPEPASIAMLATGLLLAARRKTISSLDVFRR